MKKYLGLLFYRDKTVNLLLNAYAESCQNILPFKRFSMIFSIEILEFVSKVLINYFKFFFIRLLFEKKVNALEMIVMYVVSLKFQVNVV